MELNQEINDKPKRYYALGSRKGIGGRKAAGEKKATDIRVWLPGNLIDIGGGVAAMQDVAKAALISHVGKIIHKSFPQSVELITQIETLK